MINDEILNIAKQAYLKISGDEAIVALKHQFSFRDKANLGTVLFLLGGLFLIIASFIWTVETASKIIGLVLGLFLFLLSVLTIIKQITDKVQIKNHILRFQFNLKRRSIPLDGSEKVKMKSEVVKINRVGTMGSEFIIITHLLITQNQEMPIFQFQMDNSNSDNAFKLGTELTRIFNLAFRSF